MNADHQELQVVTGHLELEDQLVNQDQPDHRAREANQVLMEAEVILAHKVLQVSRVNQDQQVRKQIQCIEQQSSSLSCVHL